MRAIVVGAGEVGFDVAQILSRDQQHDVVVIDVNAGALAAVREKLDVMVILGNGSSADVLKDAGAARADILIAVTGVDEVNIIACMLADRLGVKTKVARVRSDELTRTNPVLRAKELGIDLVIHPEESAAAEVVRLVRRASATDVLVFAGGRLQLVGMRLDDTSPVLGKSLREIAQEHADLRFRVMAIGRGIRTILPRGDDTLRRNDQVFVLAQPKTVAGVTRALGKSDLRIDAIMILGGSLVGARVALELSDDKKRRIKLIESDRAQAERLAEGLSNVLVIHGDPTDMDLLTLEGLSDMDAVASVTNDEESNLVACLLAKHLGVHKTIALLSKAAYIPMSQSIGLDAAVNKKLAVSREILRFLRGKHVLSVATVHGLDAEILELQAAPRSRITRGPLDALSMPEGLLIGAVLHGNGVEVATGETRVEPGDRVIVFAMPPAITEVERFFRRS
jgi:trk system potassium uptake protein